MPLYFPGVEFPDPVPDAPVKGAAAGFPITATFPARAPVKAAEAWLEDESGAAVDAWVSSPDKPANPNAAAAQRNTIGIIAKAPLRPGVRYAVQIEARVEGREQRRAWTFLTAGADDLHHDFEDRFLARINAARERNGLEPTALDPAASLACAAHARYVSLNYPAHPSLNRNDETPDWPGASEEGRKVAARCLCQPAVGSADHTVDLLMGSLAIRQAFLEPKVKQIGLGSSWLGANGGCWVLALPDFGEWAEVHPVILYPYPDQQSVPTLYTGDAPSRLPADAPDKPAGQPVTVRFRWHKPTDKVTGRLTDAAGQEVPTWLSTPQKPLPNQSLFVACLLPREPLRAGETYTATVAAELDGKPWTKTWSFTTMRPADADLPALEAKVLASVNAVRKEAGLNPVEMDAALSRGCRLHAKYLVANENRAGLVVGNEDAKYPEATPEGARAARAALVAQGVPDPAETVDPWMNTFYHRIPILAPELRKVGFGCAPYPNGSWATVLDVQIGK